MDRPIIPWKSLTTKIEVEMKKEIKLRLSEESVEFLQEKLSGLAEFTPNSKRSAQLGRKSENKRVILCDTNQKFSDLYSELLSGNILDMIFLDCRYLEFQRNQALLKFDTAKELMDKFQIFSKDSTKIALPTANVSSCRLVSQDFFQQVAPEEILMIMATDALIQISDNANDYLSLEDNLHILDYNISPAKMIAQDDYERFFRPVGTLSHIIKEIQEGNISRARYRNGGKIISIDPDGIWEFTL